MKTNILLLILGYFVTLHASSISRFEPELNKNRNIGKTDKSICGAAIDNPASIQQNLSGKIARLLRNNEYKRTQFSFPYFLLANKKKTEILNITLFPGNDCCQLFSVSRIEKERYSSDSSYTINTNHKYFITNNGIKLGVSKIFFWTVFEKNRFVCIKSGATEIFKTTLPGDDPAGYVAYYVFRNDLLEKYSFGINVPDFDYLKNIGE